VGELLGRPGGPDRRTDPDLVERVRPAMQDLAGGWRPGIGEDFGESVLNLLRGRLDGGSAQLIYSELAQGQGPVPSLRDLAFAGAVDPLGSRTAHLEDQADDLADQLAGLALGKAFLPESVVHRVAGAREETRDAGYRLTERLLAAHDLGVDLELDLVVQQQLGGLRELAAQVGRLARGIEDPASPTYGPVWLGPLADRLDSFEEELARVAEWIGLLSQRIALFRAMRSSADDNEAWADQAGTDDASSLGSMSSANVAWEHADLVMAQAMAGLRKMTLTEDVVGEPVEPPADPAPTGRQPAPLVHVAGPAALVPGADAFGLPASDHDYSDAGSLDGSVAQDRSTAGVDGGSARGRAQAQAQGRARPAALRPGAATVGDDVALFQPLIGPAFEVRGTLVPDPAGPDDAFVVGWWGTDGVDRADVVLRPVDEPAGASTAPAPRRKWAYDRPRMLGGQPPVAADDDGSVGSNGSSAWSDSDDLVGVTDTGDLVSFDLGQVARATITGPSGLIAVSYLADAVAPTDIATWAAAADGSLSAGWYWRLGRSGQFTDATAPWQGRTAVAVISHGHQTGFTLSIDHLDVQARRAGTGPAERHLVEVDVDGRTPGRTVVAGLPGLWGGRSGGPGGPDVGPGGEPDASGAGVRADRSRVGLPGRVGERAGRGRRRPADQR
jgi:hypothetical protein